MNAIDEALAQANLHQHERWEMWHYRAEPTELPTRTWLSTWLFGEPQRLTATLVLHGQQSAPTGPGGISYDMWTTGYLQFLSPSYVRLPTSFLDAHFVLGKEGEEGLPEADLRPVGSMTVLIRTNEATFCVVCKDVIFTRDEPYGTLPIPIANKVEEINTTLDPLDGVALEWRGYSPEHWSHIFVLKVTDSLQGVGCIFAHGTRYVNFPQVMHNVRIRAATGEESEDQRRQFRKSERVREQNYHIIECQEGRFTIDGKGFRIVWGDRALIRLRFMKCL